MIPGTRILAGLCGFKPLQIEFLGDNFDSYYESVKDVGYGVDQDSIIEIFDRKDWLADNFLDCSISTDKHTVGTALFPCTQRTEKDYQHKCDHDIMFDIINERVDWAGEPTDFRGAITDRLLQLRYKEFKTLKEIFDNVSKPVKKFYKYDQDN